jgi:hypothetical protein
MDVMAKALANIFHQSGRALDLLVPVIQSEVSKTGTHNENNAKFGNNVWISCYSTRSHIVQIEQHGE